LDITDHNSLDIILFAVQESMPNILKWSIPADDVLELCTARIAVRPSKFHWGKERAAVFKSLAALNREIDFIGCTAKCNNYLEYNGRSCVNVFFDIEWMQDAPVVDGLALARIIAEVINPVIAALFNLTTHSQVADEIVVEQCHRLVGDQWKASFHVIFPDFCLHGKQSQCNGRRLRPARLRRQDPIHRCVASSTV